MKAWANTKLQAGIRSLSVAQMLAVREFAAELRVSRMSVVWPVLYPLLYAVLLVLIRPYFGSASQASPLQYGVFVFVGMCLWQSWIDSLRR
jgi:ABC-type polysaccharide/polyol phosphate export permease